MTSIDFFDLIFGSTNGGYVRLGFRKKGQRAPKFQSFRWPEQRDLIISCRRAKNDGDIFFNPALFSVKDSGLKRDVLGAAVGWVDLDTSTSYQAAHDAPWSALVASGSPSHAHGYRLAGSILAPRNLESFNRHLTEEFGGDQSGWDANQLLRVPDTFNFKTDPPKPVKVLKLDSSQIWKPPEFSEPDQQPLQLEDADLADILLHSNFNSKLRGLISQHPLECFDRSAALWKLCSIAIESGFTGGQAYVLLEHADKRWGKFSERDDKQLRLTEIVQRVTNGKLIGVSELPTSKSIESVPVGIITLQKTVPEFKWVVKDVIHEKGLTVFLGETAEGKSTLALNLAIKVAGGFKSWLDFPIPTSNQKILYASHEMDQSQLNNQTSKMTSINPFPEFAGRVDENLKIYATGYSIPLDLKSGQELYEGFLNEGEYTGLVIDTLGSSVSTSLSDEKPMRQIVDWLMETIQNYNIWVLVLHHIRKGQQLGKKSTRVINVEDSYGARLLIDRASSVFYTDRFNFSNRKARFSGGDNSIGLTYTKETNWIERGSTLTVGGSSGSEITSISDLPDGSVEFQ